MKKQTWIWCNCSVFLVIFFLLSFSSNLEFLFMVSVCSIILTVASKWKCSPKNGHCLCMSYIFSRLNALFPNRVHGRMIARMSCKKKQPTKILCANLFCHRNLWQSKIAFVVCDKFSSWYIKCKVCRCYLLVVQLRWCGCIKWNEWKNALNIYAHRKYSIRKRNKR